MNGRWLWILTATDPISTAQNGQVISDLLPVSSLEENMRAGAVVTRVIGNMFVRIDASDLDGALTWAFYTQRREAFEGAIAPELDLDEYAYMWYDSAAIKRNAVLSSAEGNQWERYAVDIKTKRRFVSQEDTLVLERENTSADVVAMTSFFRGRTLLRIK